MRQTLKLLTLIIIFSISILTAAMEYTPSNIMKYKKYYKLTQISPENKRYHFEFAMVLSQMGKIEEASKEFSKINDLDENYAKKIVKILERIDAKNPSYENSFKLGFCYYFLYEELNGRMDLASRRIKRGKRDGDQERVAKERKVIAELAPTANIFREKSLAHFKKVAKKQPKDSLNAWGYAYMAVVKGIEDDWETAKNYCEKAIKILPDAYAIRAAYMEALKQNGNTLSAAGQMTKALRLKSSQEKYDEEIFGDEYKYN